MITTGIWCLTMMFLTVVMPFMTGMSMSRVITSGFISRILLRHSCPLAAVPTTWIRGSLARICPMTLRIMGASSTMRVFTGFASPLDCDFMIQPCLHEGLGSVKQDLVGERRLVRFNGPDHVFAKDRIRRTQEETGSRSQEGFRQGGLERFRRREHVDVQAASGPGR